MTTVFPSPKDEWLPHMNSSDVLRERINERASKIVACLRSRRGINREIDRGTATFARVGADRHLRLAAKKIGVRDSRRGEQKEENVAFPLA